ncbi:MAG: hypothetical protein FJY36_09170, partial [Betaproteobacteria bacterium]|nr:hypothetical protein [Betaproteobacteria bacterium]
MNSLHKIVVTTGKDREVFDLAASAARGTRPVRIRVVDGARLELSGADTQQAQAPFLPPALKVRRLGLDLLLWLDGHSTPDAVLEGYYDGAGEGRALLLGQAADGTWHEYLALESGGGVAMQALSESAEPLAVVLGEDTLGQGAAVGALLPAVATGPGALAAALGGVAAAGAGGGGGGGGGGGAALLTQGQALDAIRAAAQGNTASASSVPVSAYTLAGVNGVNRDNLDAINDVLNSHSVDAAALGSTATDTVAKLQAIVDAYVKVLAAADGRDGNHPNAPTAGDYAILSLTGVNEASAALLSDVIDGKPSTAVDSVAELQALADAAKAVLNYSTSAAGAPTADQISSLV